MQQSHCKLELEFFYNPEDKPIDSIIFPTLPALRYLVQSINFKLIYPINCWLNKGASTIRLEVENSIPDVNSYRANNRGKIASLIDLSNAFVIVSVYWDGNQVTSDEIFKTHMYYLYFNTQQKSYEINLNNKLKGWNYNKYVFQFPARDKILIVDHINDSEHLKMSSSLLGNY